MYRLTVAMKPARPLPQTAALFVLSEGCSCAIGRQELVEWLVIEQ